MFEEAWSAYARLRAQNPLCSHFLKSAALTAVTGVQKKRMQINRKIPNFDDIYLREKCLVGASRVEDFSPVLGFPISPQHDVPIDDW